MQKRSFSWMRVFIFTVCVAVAGFLPVGATAQVADEYAAKVKSVDGYDGLRSLAAKNGTVRILVEVNAPFTPDVDLKAETAEGQRAYIAVMQDELLRGLKRAGKSPVKSYKYMFTPYLAMTVDAAALDAILESTAAVSVQEDISLTAVLDKSVPLIGADILQKAKTGKGYVVAVLDSGVDKNHPFLKESVVSEACYSTNDKQSKLTSLCPKKVTESTDDGSAMPYAGKCPKNECHHGTHVAGIVAGRAGVEESPGPGVAPEVGIIAIQVFSRVDSAQACASLGEKSPCTSVQISDLKKGLERVYALRGDHKIAAVNMSLGGGQYAGKCDDLTIKSDIDLLRAAGIVSIIASGNSGYCGYLAAPACISTAVSVGATDVDDQVGSYSNSASSLHLFAPGSAITSSVPKRGYAPANGTSMAAPHVSGAWALMKQVKPTATIEEILAAFTSTGKAVTDGKCGSVTKARINVNDAYKSIDTKQYLTVAKSGAGAGTVTSAPDGINCGTRCAALFDNGASVTLTAAASSGNSFTGWSGGGCSGTDTCTVTMTGAMNVTAAFGSSCAYNFSPSHTTAGGKGKELSVAVTSVPAEAHGACGAPSVLSDNPWIIASLSSFKNNKGKVAVTILGNDNPSPRTGTMSIAGGRFVVNQDRTDCSPPTLGPTSATVQSSAGSGSFDVNINGDCEWQSSVDYFGRDWITITSGSKMSGAGTVSYSFTANSTGSTRRGFIRVFRTGTSDWRQFTVVQGK